MVRPLRIAENREMARRFLADSEREFAAGETRQSLDTLWDATRHAVTAAAQRRGWPHDSSADLREAVRQLAAQSGDNGFLISGFLLAGVFHTNSYHGLYSSWLEPGSLDQARENVRVFVERLLVFSEGASPPPANGAGPS